MHSFLLLAALFAAPALAASDEAKLFDLPQEVRVLALPDEESVRENFQPHVTCTYYPGFMVKEEDLGELGATRHAILRSSAHKPDCERVSAEETVVTNWWGYFLGAKGRFLFIEGADSFSGSKPFGVVSADTLDGRPLVIDARLSFKALRLEGDELLVQYTRTLLPGCSLLTELDCWTKLRAATGLAEDRRPDCKKAYSQKNPQMPDVPSVIAYPAEMRIAAGRAAILARPGSVSCWPQS